MEQVQFSNDGTLDSWLEKIVNANSLQIADRAGKMTLKHDYLEQAHRMYEGEKILLADLGFLPSFSQFACAIIASMLFSHNKKILLSVPPGKGKSRIICAIAAFLGQYRTTIKKVYICFTSEILLETDKHVYTRLNDA